MMNALLLANGCITLWSHKTEALMQNKTVNICLLIVNEIGKYFFFLWIYYVKQRPLPSGKLPATLKPSNQSQESKTKSSILINERAQQ
jgi:hypothetical protein